MSNLTPDQESWGELYLRDVLGCTEEQIAALGKKSPDEEEKAPFQCAAFINPKMAAWGREQLRKRDEQQEKRDKQEEKSELKPNEPINKSWIKEWKPDWDGITM